MISNQFIKFQGSSFSSFWDILLTNDQIYKRGITHKIFFRIYLKVNQVIYSLLAINSLSVKALAVIVLRYFVHKVNDQNYKGP